MNRASNEPGHYGRVRPDVAHEHRPAFGVHAERLVDKVGVEDSGTGVGQLSKAASALAVPRGQRR